MNGKVMVFIAAAVLFSCFISFVPRDAAGYGISYDYYVYATGSDGIPIMDDQTINGLAEIHEIHTKTGDPGAGNYGQVNFYANLHTGSVGARSFANGGVTDYWPYGFVATGRTYNIGFFIYLYFTVPAGYYADGVEVSVSGVARGVLSSTEAAGAKATYYIHFGFTTLSPGLMEIGVDEDNEIGFTHPFTLTQQIVGEGATLGTTTEYSLQLQAYISSNWAWSVRHGTSPNYTIGSSLIDFYNGIQFSSVNVPEGVTWDSESGIFMDQVPTDVCDPGMQPRPTLLNQNHPNPFNPVTTISYYLAEPAFVKLGIYDVTGKLVKVLQDRRMIQEGNQKMIWNGRNESGKDVASGVYFYRLDTGSFSKTKKMVKLR